MAKRGVCGKCGCAVVNFAAEHNSGEIVNGHWLSDSNQLIRVLCKKCSYIVGAPFNYVNDYEPSPIYGCTVGSNFSVRTSDWVTK